MSESTNVRVLAGARKPGTYVYMPADSAVEDLPEQLRVLLGEVRQVLELSLTKDRQLARCTGIDVLEGIAVAGYYVQMPPGEFIRHDDVC